MLARGRSLFADDFLSSILMLSFFFFTNTSDCTLHVGKVHILDSVSLSRFLNERFLWGSIVSGGHKLNTWYAREVGEV